MPADKAGRVVFVGNIPYGLSEEQVVHLLGQCGQVLSFRLVYDKDTGRPKGFGFAEFSDADAAASAVRNLNGYETMGRTLKVDYSNEAGTGESGATAPAMPSNQQSQQSISQQQHFQQFQQQHQQQQQPSNVPVGVNLPDNVSAPDAISRTLAAIEPDQLLSVVAQMKELIATEPLRVHQLLTEKPQLAYAMFQALLLMGLVDTAALSQVVAPGPVKPGFQPQPAPVQFQQQPPQLPPPNPYAQMPPQAQPAPLPAQFQPPFQPHMGATPVHNQAYAPPPMPPAIQRPPHLSEQQWESILQICRIPQQMVDTITNQEERNSILSIRQQYLPYVSGGIRGY